MKHLVNVLHAPARAEAKEQAKKLEELEKKEAEEERIREEKEQKEEEEAQKKREAEEAEKRKKEEEEAETMRREEEETRQQEAATAATAAANAAMEVDNAATEDVPDDVAEVMNLARSLAAGLAVPSTGTSTPAPQEAPSASTPAAQPAVTVEASASGNEISMNAEASGSGENQLAAPAERVTILVHGEEVDITDTGIDREFLEALPDDMRDEVIRQHLRESRRAAEPAPPIPADMDAEFLNALPPDMRADLIRQAAADARRSQAASASASRGDAGAAAAPAPADMDPADFLATLDPALRGAVLTDEEDDGYDEGGQALAHANGAGPPPRARRSVGAVPAGARIPIQPVDAAKKSTPAREVIQLLDKSGLATLVRLLFFPHSLRRNSLQKTLTNLCENHRTRVELINLLLTILHDGTRDVAAVDKSFSQMSIRASKALGGSKDTPRRKVPETPGGALPHIPGESVPNLIAQRCLEALLFLVSANEQTPLFFLSEQEISVTKRTSKKGKGKEKVRFFHSIPFLFPPDLFLCRPPLSPPIPSPSSSVSSSVPHSSRRQR
jgi:E3 ubiquitin-protein ligase HUWE1